MALRATWGYTKAIWGPRFNAFADSDDEGKLAHLFKPWWALTVIPSQSVWNFALYSKNHVKNDDTDQEFVLGFNLRLPILWRRCGSRRFRPCASRWCDVQGWIELCHRGGRLHEVAWMISWIAYANKNPGWVDYYEVIMILPSSNYDHIVPCGNPC